MRIVNNMKTTLHFDHDELDQANKAFNAQEAFSALKDIRYNCREWLAAPNPLTEKAKLKKIIEETERILSRV